MFICSRKIDLIFVVHLELMKQQQSPCLTYLN